MELRTQIKKIIKPVYNLKFGRYLIDGIGKELWSSRILRRCFTNNFTSPYLAVGEQNKYFISPQWVTLDMIGADFNYDIRSLTAFPFQSEHFQAIYSSHMIEHLPAEACQHFFNESYRLLKKGGVLRIEAPDVKKIVSRYKNGNYDFFINLLNKEEKQELGANLNIHDIFIGLISCYIENDKHIPIKLQKEEIGKNLSKMSLDEFCSWCVPAQTGEQINSGGHIHPVYVDKVFLMLKRAGFENIKEVQIRKSTDRFLEKKLAGIERLHRESYSFYLEAKK